MLLDRIITFFTSLRLTVVCLCLGLVLVFFGTLAQVDLGLYKAQNDFFRSFLVYWAPQGADWKIPIFPGGYLLGSVLLLNLVAAHIKRFSLTRKKAGIFMIHAGLILLLLGQLLTDMLSVESGLHLRVGESRDYSEEDLRFELAVVDTSDPDSDKVVAISNDLLKPNQVIRHAALPFAIKIDEYFPNSSLSTTNDPAKSFRPSPATEGMGVGLWLKAQPKVTSTDFRDMPTGILEIMDDQGSSGKRLVSSFLNPQPFTFNQRTYQLALRPTRHYTPFSLELLNFNHATYKGTDIPKDFSSRVRLRKPATGEDREVLIYMNNPLRYAGETYYQAGFDQDDRGTVLQVVHNPGWLTPYFSCVLMGVGMVIQFLSHLVPFLKRRIMS
jgi:hypothetical protein